MLEIWGRANSINVQKVLWAVDELGVPYRRHDIGGEYGGNDDPAYRAMNPNGRVPTVVDGGDVVWESNACLRYLSARFGRGSLWAEDPGERSLADRWMDWQQTTLSDGMRIVFWDLVRTPPEKRDPAGRAAALRALSGAWGLLDRHLAGRSFVAGEAFTMGDIPAGAMVNRWFKLPIDRPDLPNLAAWYARLCERPAYRRHIVDPPLT